MTKMKGITCCGDCGYYNWKKHKCTRATDEGDARSNFYADCPLPDVVSAQEPRVMTLEEVVTAKLGTVVWLEDFDKPDVISGLLKRVFIYTKVIDFLIVKEEVNNEVTADLEVYGSEWRCWTAEPTEEQRRATPWVKGITNG